MGVYLALVTMWPMGYLWATYENLYGEWFQVFLFAASMVLSARLALRSGHPYRWFFALLGLASFYVVGEEISWGQQVFDWETPEWLKDRNLQGETNLHNMVTGPYATQLKEAIEIGLAVALVGYGLVYPLVIRAGLGVARWLEARGLAAPPLSLWPFWVLGAVLELGLVRFNEAEVAEVLISFALAATAWHHLATVGRGAETHDPTTWAEAGPAIVRGTLALVVVPLLLAVGTTQAMWAHPPTRARMESRIGAGVEKFAARYARVEAWDVSAELYVKARQRKPHSLALLRKHAAVMQAAGRDEEATAILEEAVAYDLGKLRRDPTSASAHRSLVRSYRLLGNDERASHHLGQAFHIARTRIHDHPDSANAHYALGRAHELAGQWADALAAFEEAVSLNPDKKKFRKAVFRMREALEDPG